MSKTLDCPNCGAPLENIQWGSLTIKCPFCHSTVLLPTELLGAMNREPADAPVSNILEHTLDLKRMADLARSGKQVEAIRIYREVFDTSLTESKRAIDAIAAGQPVILPGQMKVISTTPSQTESLQKIAKLYIDVSPLEAIKLFKKTYGTSLRESKELFEKLAAGGLVPLPDGTVFQLTQGFTDMTTNTSQASMSGSRNSRSAIGILAVAGIAIGLMAVIIAIIFGVVNEKHPESLVAPFSTETPSPTPTEVPFASTVFTFGG